MTTRNLPLVVLWMSGSLVSFSLTAIAVRVLARTLGVFEILAIRSALGLALLAAAAVIWPRLRPGFRLRRPWLQLLRNIPHTLGQAGWSYGLTACRSRRCSLSSSHRRCGWRSSPCRCSGSA